MISCRIVLGLGVSVLCLAPLVSAQEPRSREERGAPIVTVSHEADRWIIAGRRNRVTLTESDLSVRIDAGTARWNLVSSAEDDMLVKSRGEEFFVRLADAGKVDIAPYDTGYATGVKITLQQFRHNGLANKGVELDLSLYLTVCLEGEAEELVFHAAANEGEAVVRQLDWPKALDARDVDHTVLSNRRGTLLPRDWPKEYNPIRPGRDGVIDPKDTSVVQSNLIECWSMSWWGFQKGPSAMMLIVETPDDASYKFHHPAGGPTVLGPRWRATLGSLRYARSVRMIFFAKGNYVKLHFSQPCSHSLVAGRDRDS